MKMKLAALATVPPAVVTVSGPLVAAAGTVAVIWVAESTLKVAAAPLKVTALAPLKLLPVTITEAPTAPVAGVKLVMMGEGTGGASGVSATSCVVVPPAVMTTPPTVCAT